MLVMWGSQKQNKEKIQILRVKKKKKKISNFKTQVTKEDYVG